MFRYKCTILREPKIPGLKPTVRSYKIVHSVVATLLILILNLAFCAQS
jgi:hypothetical protein